MSLRDDLDGQATTVRARRRPDDRIRQAGRLVARAEWLSDALVWWTGQREEVPRLADGPLALRAALQDRLDDLPPGLYAVRVRRGRRRPFSLEFDSVEAVTRERVASSARAIESAGRFPRAAERFVGPVPAWRARATTLLEGCRRAVEGAAACPTGASGALALEARALWLGAGRPPSVTLPAAALEAACRDADAAVARLAALALGGRRAASAAPARLAAWARVGLALGHWPSGVAARQAAVIGPDILARLASGAPLNDPIAAWWAEERALDPAAIGPTELRGLAALLSALRAVREEPDRRHAILRRLASQSHQVAWRRGSAGATATPEELAAGFRDAVLDQVFGGVGDMAEACRPRVAANLFELGERWVGEGALGPRLYAYLDSLTTETAAGMGGQAAFGPGSALDPAGAVAAVAAANRLRGIGAANACEALAAWIEACRPLVSLGSFWRDVFAILPAGQETLDERGARALAASLDRHGRRLALVLALDADAPSAEMRRLLPAVLVRGPVATQRALEHGLWPLEEPALDAALEWLDGAERAAAVRGDDEVPVPRAAFHLDDAILRGTLLRIGLRVLEDGRASAGEVERLLAVLAWEVPRRCPERWVASRAVLEPLAPMVAGRLRRRAAASGREVDASLVHLVLEACARWEGAGFGDTRRLARILADRWTDAGKAEQEWKPDDRDRHELLVRLSEGRISRLLALLQQHSAPREYPWRAIDGWTLVQKHATARAWISACLDRPEIVPRAIRLLERIALLARLEPGMTAARLFAPLGRPLPAPDPLASRMPADLGAVLGQIQLAHGVAHPLAPWPKALRQPLERAERVGWDEASLRQLARVLPKQAALVGLAALETIAGRDLAARWRRLLRAEPPGADSPAWDHALHMLLTVEYNRRILARLLRRAALGDRTWMRDLEPNRAFLAALEAAGLRPGEWLAERSLVVASPVGSLTAYAATDPLEVLQMGSLFGTCLSAGKFNAHAAVAAAVEVNKRVLYVKDAAGRVLGRRLVALTRSGELVGFTTYGAGADGPGTRGAWVKLALERLALEMARACGASPMPAARVAVGLSDDEEKALMLFCRGYVDTPEPFDLPPRLT